LLIANVQPPNNLSQSIVQTLIQVFKDLTNKRKVRAEIINELVHEAMNDFT